MAAAYTPSQPLRTTAKAAIASTEAVLAIGVGLSA
jgi:hypothetical protein